MFHKRLRQALRVYHLKLVHDLLPLGSRRYREATTKDDQLKLCPCCRLVEETPTHYLQCQKNPAFETSLATMKSDILTTDTHPVRYLLADGLRHWSTSSLPFCPSITQYPPHFQPLLATALTSQTAIGWNNVCKGLLSGSWFQIAQLGMIHATSDPRLGAARLKSIHQAFFDHTRRLWTARNSVLHSKDDSSLLSIRSTEAAEIKFYHSRPHLLRLGDQQYCQKPLERILNGPASTRRRWLRKVKQSSVELTKDGTRQSLITSFFRPSS